MARPLRIEYAGALYHTTLRGDCHEDIYRDNEGRKQWLEILSQVCDRFNWVVQEGTGGGFLYHIICFKPLYFCYIKIKNVSGLAFAKL